MSNKWVAGAGDETGNSYARRVSEGYFEKYFKGDVIDIGCGKQTVTEGARGWDIASGDGDATFMAGIADSSYDTVYSSHTLEHLDNPELALENWWRILKPQGYLIVAVPSEDLYEQNHWPSMFNPDHRTTWTTSKSKSWSPVSKNLVDLIKQLPNHKLISLRELDTNYDYSLKFCDQPKAERQIEAIVQKLEQSDEEKYINSRMQLFQCMCGFGDLHMQGLRIDGRIILKCQSCKQVLSLDIIKTLIDDGILEL